MALLLLLSIVICLSGGVSPIDVPIIPTYGWQTNEPIIPSPSNARHTNEPVIPSPSHALSTNEPVIPSPSNAWHTNEPVIPSQFYALSTNEPIIPSPNAWKTNEAMIPSPSHALPTHEPVIPSPAPGLSINELEPLDASIYMEGETLVASDKHEHHKPKFPASEPEPPSHKPTPPTSSMSLNSIGLTKSMGQDTPQAPSPSVFYSRKIHFKYGKD